MVSFWGGNHKGDAKHRTDVGQRHRHIVTVAHIGQRPPSNVSKSFLHREDVGQSLAGVGVIREGVDDVAAGVSGEVFNKLLRECP